MHREWLIYIRIGLQGLYVTLVIMHLDDVLEIITLQENRVLGTLCNSSNYALK